MKLLNQATELLPLDSVRPHPRNPRQGDIGAIHESITANGFYGTIIAQRSTGYILAGNHRWQALRKTGVNTVPVTWVDVDDDHALRILLADNRTNDLATYDDTALAELLKDVMADAGTLAGTGYDGDDLDDLLKDLGQDQPVEDAPEAQVDRADELQKKWGTALGQLWQIGPHRLLCGDSTEPASYQRLLGGERAALVWTDPPWNVDYGQTRNPRWKQRAIKNDNLGDAFGAFIETAFEHITSYALPGAPIYVAMSAQEWPTLDAALRSHGWHWSSTIIWAKDRLVLSRKDYHTQYEPIWYGWKEGAARLSPLEDRKQSDLWPIDRPSRSDEHPTMKPPELVARSIENSSSRGDAVLDPFLGSGTTLVAAQQTHRVGLGIELEPKYVAVTLERLADMGLTPELTDETD